MMQSYRESWKSVREIEKQKKGNNHLLVYNIVLCGILIALNVVTRIIFSYAVFWIGPYPIYIVPAAAIVGLSAYMIRSVLFSFIVCFISPILWFPFGTMSGSAFINFADFTIEYWLPAIACWSFFAVARSDMHQRRWLMLVAIISITFIFRALMVLWAGVLFWRIPSFAGSFLLNWPSLIIDAGLTYGIMLAVYIPIRDLKATQWQRR